MIETKFAILNGIKTSHKCIAICEVWTYDVRGNARDGFEVNDRSCQDRAARLTAECEVSGLPARPGASDLYRSFTGEDASFRADMLVSFGISDKLIAAAFGLTAAKVEIEGGGMRYDVSLAKNGMPIGEVIIVGWEDAND